MYVNIASISQYLVPLIEFDFQITYVVQGLHTRVYLVILVVLAALSGLSFNLINNLVSFATFLNNFMGFVMVHFQKYRLFSTGSYSKAPPLKYLKVGAVGSEKVCTYGHFPARNGSKSTIVNQKPL